MIEILHGTHETVNFSHGSGFQLYDNTDNEEYPIHWHPEMEIITPLRNIYTAVINGQTYTMREGDILIIGSGVLHRLLKQEGERIIFQPSFSLLHNIEELESVLSLLPPVFLITPEKDPDIHQKIHRIILEMKEEYFARPPLAEAAIYYRLIEMFVLIGRKYSESAEKFEGISRKKKEYTEKFMDICSYINDHCVENLTLEETANLAGFSKYHFTRLFKSFTGITFYKYLNQKRIAHAEKLLIDPEISITDVALHSGFNSLSTFIRMFKLLKNCTPTEFRSMYNY